MLGYLQRLHQLSSGFFYQEFGSFEEREFVVLCVVCINRLSQYSVSVRKCLRV